MSNFKYSFLDGIVLALYFITIGFFLKSFGFIDIKDHNLILSNYLSEGYFPIPPGYYFLVYLVDLLIRIKYSFVVSSAIVLTALLWWKYKLTYLWIFNSIKIKEWHSFLLSFSFLFVSPIFIPLIDGDLWYLGKFTQTIWHNSTLICVFPFCLLLTQKTLKWLDSKDHIHLLYMVCLGLVILLIKPSFLFCFIPALPLYVLERDRKLSSQFLQSTFLVGFFFLLLLLEKYLIFSWDPMINQLYTHEEKSSVVINPFAVWIHHSYEPLFDFISSFPLLLVFLVVWKKTAFKSSFFKFSLLLLIFALTAYFLFSETGLREFHGNFYWQIPIALFLNSLSILLVVIQDFKSEGKKFSIRYYTIVTVYAIQVGMGVTYWLRIFIERTLS